MQMNKSEYRPCIVSVRINERVRGACKKQYEEHRALFHRWSERYWTTAALFVNEVSGQQSHTVGIVEYEDGTIHEHYPQEIQFTDGKAKEVLKENSESHSQTIQEAVITLRDELLKHSDVYNGFLASIMSVLEPREEEVSDLESVIYAEFGTCALANDILKRIIGEK